MKNKVVKISKEEEKKLTPNEYNEYYYALRNAYEQSFIGRLDTQKRKFIHPILLSTIKLRNRINGFKLYNIGDLSKKTEQPKIFCITHIGKYDIEVVSEIIKEHYYLLSGDFENIHGTIDGQFLGLNGVIYVKEDDKNDRNLSKSKMISILLDGGNIMYFPEGTWNLSPNLPVLQLPYGIIEIAIKANAIIIPVAIEQYGKEFISKIGRNFDASQYGLDNKIEAINDLRSEMASLKWDIWQCVPGNERQHLDNNSFKQFIDDRISEWPNFGLEEFYDRVFKPKGIIEEKDVFKHLETIELDKNNAFLAKPKNEYVKKYIIKK